MARKTNLTYARRGDVIIEFALDSTTTPAVSGWKTFGCLVGDPSYSDSRGAMTEAEFNNWCFNQDNDGAGVSGFAQWKPGDRTIQFSGTAEIDLSDGDYKSAFDAYKALTTFQLRYKMVNAESTTVGSHTIMLLGKLTQFNRVARDGEGGAGTAQYAFVFHANQKIGDTLVKGVA